MATNETPDVAAEGGDTRPVEDPGGSYEVLRNRLADHGRELVRRTEALNLQRKQTFGGTELQVIGNVRVRTENNCVPTEIISIGDLLLFGFTVHLGLKSQAEVGDVFSLHRFEQTAEGFELPAVPLDRAGGFLQDRSFVRDLGELYQFYKDPVLLQLRTTQEQQLLAAFRVGENIDDVKVFVWQLDGRGGARYVDNRGERQYRESFPPSHDFRWKSSSRDMHVAGRHPHVNLEDECFIETIGGDLTIKIENNTEDGYGIYREPVQEAEQSLDDAQISYARVGSLILIKVLPYREDRWRHFVFNTKTKQAVRIDAIGRSCVQLPEDHGIIFPGGYYLQGGAYKVFDDHPGDLEFQQVVRSPNGEDVLYVFLTRKDGTYLLLPYNLIGKEVQNPIQCHGYTLFADGKLVIFRVVSDEASRVHPMQIWQTQFTSVEHAAKAPTNDSILARVGNADLVRGISDAFSVRRLTEAPVPARHVFEDIVKLATRMIDHFYWLADPGVGNLEEPVREVRKTAELIIDEFEKVLALQNAARDALAQARQRQLELARDLKPEHWREIERFMQALADLRHQRGRLITLREMRFMDLAGVDALEQEAITAFDTVSQGCARFLQTDEAFVPLVTKLEEHLARIPAIEKTNEAVPIREDLDRTSEGLNVLSEVSAGLKLDDPTARTRILESISEVFATLNRVRATLEVRRKELLGAEGRAEFAAQFKLLGQSMDSALARADSPDACDDLLGQVMLLLEEIEGKFSELDEFLDDLAKKREEIHEAFSGRKQTLLEERQRRAQNIATAANRILEGAARRAKSFGTADDLNAYYSSDPMLLKLRDLIRDLAALGDNVKADELESKLKAARQDALRLLRDRTELFEEGENVIKLGRHRFSVNTQPLELTMLPHGDGMAYHLTGTDFYEQVDDQAFLATKDLWGQALLSENRDVYRGEYLAACLLSDADQEKGGLSVDGLRQAAQAGDQSLLAMVRRYATDRYDEGYDRGVHDADAAAILSALLAARSTVGLLRFAPTPRALACFFWACFEDEERRNVWLRKARSLSRLRSQFRFSPAINDLAAELSGFVRRFNEGAGVPCTEADVRTAGRYLVEELMAAERPVFTTSAEAAALRDALLGQLDQGRARSELVEDIGKLADRPAEAFDLAFAWVDAFVSGAQDERLASLAHARTEAAVLLVTDRRIDRQVSTAVSTIEVKGLLGQHQRIENGTLRVRLDEFLERVGDFMHAVVPRYREYRKIRGTLVERQRAALRLDEFKPRVLTSFVRNKLINEVYLPLIGDNLAKQLGTIGESKRTDLMGLLLLISPPGYGKTTLMEYLASQLGLVFMKINGPSLGHAVVSLDPKEAPNATAAQEVDKINLALEMGNNVMLYIDDIQHTNPELLQKFISLCDAQRRIEGVWRGRTRTYDMRGKKFCMCMAGNPYTESGERFQIPDMLSNRADTYNLGDILEGKDEAFALSYIENAITSSSTLSPLASKDPNDLFLLIRMSRGEEIPPTDLSHAYAATELNDFQAVLRHLTKVQQTVLAVNQQYIASAAQDDAFRTEPPFQLQGSYRNMNKLAEKVVPALNETELQRIVDDHYLGEAQTLTTGAEWNLLRLRELRGVLSDEERRRIGEIREGYQRMKRLGGSEEDPVVRAVSQLNDIGEMLRKIGEGLRTMQGFNEHTDLGRRLDAIREGLQGLQAVDHLGTTLGQQLDAVGQGVQTRLDSIGAGLQGLQNISQLGSALGRRLDAITQGLQAMDASARQANVGQRLDSIGAGLQGIQNVGQLGTVLTQRLDAIGRGLQGMQAVNQLAQVVAQRLDAIIVALQSVDAELGDGLGKRLDGIGITLREVASRKPEPTPAERALAETVSRLREAIDKLQRPQLQVKVDTDVPETMSDMLRQQVALAENVMKLVFTLTRTFEEGGAVHVQLTAALNDIQAISHKMLRARPAATVEAQREPRTSAEATAEVVEPVADVPPFPAPEQRSRAPVPKRTPPPQTRPDVPSQPWPPADREHPGARQPAAQPAGEGRTAAQPAAPGRPRPPPRGHPGSPLTSTQPGLTRPPTQPKKPPGGQGSQGQ
jgi:hypothetical protein